MFEKIRRVKCLKPEHSILKSVKLLCTENDMSIPQLERELNFGNGSIYNWDKSFPSSDKIVKVALYFHVSSDYLLGLVEDNEQISE